MTKYMSCIENSEVEEPGWYWSKTSAGYNNVE